MLFRVKICGITSARDARAAVDAGADAIGLNFYPRSKRCVSLDTAGRIVAAIPAGVVKVGVFVNSTAVEIASTIESIGLDAVQLHGDEPPEAVAELPARTPVIRAYRCGSEGLAGLADYLAACGTHGRVPDAVLIDADATLDYGGTGQLADWTLVANDRSLLGGLPLVLAGGLTPDNVAEAICAVRPDAVDVASGVEREPGRKDAALVLQFVAAARHAFEQQ